MLLGGFMWAEEILPMETTGVEVVEVVREELPMATVDTALVVEVVEDGLSKEDTEGGKEAATDIEETGAFGGGKKTTFLRGSGRTGPVALPTITPTPGNFRLESEIAESAVEEFLDLAAADA